MIVKGIDTVEFGLELSGYFENFKEFWEVLSSMKNEAQDTGREREININNVNLKVHRKGIPFYEYQLSCDDFLIYFMDQPVLNTPPIKVRFLSSYLWSFGFQGAVERFYKWFECFKGEINCTKVSRIDICVDTDEIEFLEEDIGQIVTRAKGKTKHFVNDEYYNGRNFSGFTIGRGQPLLGRIYNKTLEIKTSQKTWFHQVWKEKSWNEEKDVWRVEFQIRRKGLKEFGVNSLEEFINEEDGIWMYLTTKWLTLKIPTEDANQTRWEVSQKWLVIQKAYINQDTSLAVRERVKIGNTAQLLDQVTGLFITIGALNNHVDIESTMEMAKQWLEDKLQKNDTTFIEQKEIRRRKFLEA
ncbi:replication initiation factor [Bacillus toyonensis]|uniref:replication initiation factor n=1 Tax=Bacillus toyonensis TaxID=155322 RepID=UPI003398A56A